MARCDLCGKTRIFGNTQTHHRGVAGGQWKRKAPKTQKIFNPNLHVAWVVNDGTRKRLHLCTKCLRIVRKIQNEEKVTKVANVATQTPAN
jgi:ribosomal protein L28